MLRFKPHYVKHARNAFLVKPTLFPPSFSSSAKNTLNPNSWRNMFNSNHPLIKSLENGDNKSMIYSESDKTLVKNYISYLDKTKNYTDDKEKLRNEYDGCYKFISTGIKHQGKEIYGGVKFQLLKFNVVAAPITIKFYECLTCDPFCSFFFLSLPTIVISNLVVVSVGITEFLIQRNHMLKGLKYHQELDKLGLTNKK